MPFNPNAIPEDSTGEGHLDEVPLHALLLTMLNAQATGRLTIDDTGPNHVYFMRGQPVGVQLSSPYCPLGQLLLELRVVDSGAYMRAQRSIVQERRMPGQVFKELGIVNDEELASVLAVQARRRFERFALMRGREFKFSRGLTFLTGFQRAPLDVHVLLFLAQKGQLPPGLLNDWLDPIMDMEVRARPGQDVLPTGPDSYEFGPPERRFLERLGHGWTLVSDLLETGTLPSAQAALLLYHLEKLGRLERRHPPPAPAVPPPRPAVAAPRASTEDVFASTPADPQHLESFITQTTDPNVQQADIHDVPTELPVEPAAPKPVSVPNSLSPATDLPPRAQPTPVAISFPSEDTLKANPKPKKKKKKRTRRDVALPSEGSSAVSRTRKEKSVVTPMPSIVIEGMDDE